MPAPLQLVIGGQEHERLVVELPGCDRPEPKGVYDFLTARVRVDVGRFRGDFECYLSAQDFAVFLFQLRRLQSEPGGTAEFSTIEGQLGFKIRGDGRGHFEVRGRALDAPGMGNELVWSLAIDQSYLPAIIASVVLISTAYPVAR